MHYFLRDIVAISARFQLLGGNDPRILAPGIARSREKDGAAGRGHPPAGVDARARSGVLFSRQCDLTTTCLIMLAIQRCIGPLSPLKQDSRRVIFRAGQRRSVWRPRTWWLTLICTLGFPVAAQALSPGRPLLDLSVRRWTVDEGLPHNTVHQISQSADGYLWLGTWEGLARFDGRRFRIYDRSSTPALRDDGVRALLIENGALLLGTSNSGMVELRQGQGRPRLVRGVPADLQIVLLQRSAFDGALWIGTEDHGVWRVELGGAIGHWQLGSGLSGDWVQSLWLDPLDGTAWIGTEQGLDRWRPGAERPVSVSEWTGGAVQALLGDVQGRLWLGSPTGLYRHTIGSRNFDAVPLADGLAVTALLQDRDHQLWVGSSSHGVFRLGRQGREQLAVAQGLSNNRVTALFEDAEGLLWIGTSGGFTQLNDAPISVIDQRRGLRDDFVRVVLEARDRSLWVAGSSGLDRLRGGRLEHIGTETPLAQQSLLSLAEEAGGRIWIGTLDRGIHWWDKDRLQPFPGNAQLRSMQVRSLLAARDGTVWIGGPAGVQHWDGRQLVDYGLGQGLPRRFVRALHQDHRDRIWAATADGAAWFDGKRFQPLTAREGLPARDVFEFASEPEGSLWLATDGGLVRYREPGLHEPGWQSWRADQGLPSDTLFRIMLVDAHLWLTSNVGLLRVSRSSLEAVARGHALRLEVEQFGRIDGMGSSQCNGGSQPAGWQGADGRLWIPTAAGLSVLDPRLLDRQQASSPSVLIETVQADGHFQEGAAPMDLGGPLKRLTVEYAGLHLRAPSRLRFRYRLVGLDAGWIETESQAPVVYTNLAPGNYRFELQAAVRPSPFSQRNSDAFVLRLAPPWWRHPAGLLLATLMLAGGVHVGWRWRLRQGLAREARLQREVARRTAELRAQADDLLRMDREREKLIAELDRLAWHDELTGLPNRRAGAQLLGVALQDSVAHAQVLSIAVLDLDRFKHINDRFGHAGGDAALVHFGQCLQASDFYCARMGGEEFLVLLPGLDCAAAVLRLDQFRQAVHACALDFHGASFVIDFSAGVAQAMAAETAEALYQRADTQLYAAKAAGRGRVLG